MPCLSAKALSCDSIKYVRRGFQEDFDVILTSPAIKNPVFHVRPSVLSLVFSLIPVVLDLSNQTILTGSSGVFGLDTLLLQVRLKLGRVPVIIWRSDLGLPVILDEVLEIVAISGCRVRDIVV